MLIMNWYHNVIIEEIHLLKHHIGRVRDNQDYGKVFLFRKSFLNKIGGFDESLKNNYLYDIKIKDIRDFGYSTYFK